MMTPIKNEIRRRRKGVATRQLILEEAERYFSKFGYHNTAITGIAETLDMSAANIHKHFRSKQDLAFAVVQVRVRSKAIVSGSTPYERLRSLLVSIITGLERMTRAEPELYYILTDVVTKDDVSEMMRNLIIERCPPVLEDIDLSLTENFPEALADIFLAICEPAIVVTTEYTALVARVDNILPILSAAMEPKARNAA